MQAGRIVQVGEPEQVFQHPESRFVAGFLGHASFLSGFVSGDVVQTDLGTIPREQIHGLADAYDKTRIDVLVRPDDVRAREVGTVDARANEVDQDDPSARAVDHDDPDGRADGRVVHRRYLGPTVLYRIELDNGDRLEVMHNHTEEVALDAPVAVDLAADHELAWFPKEMDPGDEEVVATGEARPAAADGGAPGEESSPGRDPGDAARDD
jgi:iron(III) transport system ATP-binding protein